VIAVKHGQKNLFKFSLTYREYVNQKPTSRPPLHHDAAVKRGDGEILKMLLNAGADVNVVRILGHDSTSAESPSRAEIELTTRACRVVTCSTRGVTILDFGLSTSSSQLES
jgi:hypothetical protein